MAQSLDYTSFNPKISNKKNKDNTYIDKVALANRPLSTSSLHKVPIRCDSCSAHVHPATTAIFKSNNGTDLLRPNVANIENKYNYEKEDPISVVMKKNKSNNKNNNVIDILTNDPLHEESGYYIGDYTQTNQPHLIDISEHKYNKEDKPNSDKMDITTQFYIGSITVIALFLVYRMLQK